ncbi:hypothetical protein D7V94_16475 [Parablautia intestinalis]|uniref:Uncharacterized protein n=1 Tax=Parablautia intestinalis TaxID=2320100 RepID=A0A3A9AEI0_9FIRM|nr:hypothetical protein [Parablautia intestinalis]RKI89779.1 hypothetical protein D7V94_16475 [Parablautia intestinalis]
MEIIFNDIATHYQFKDKYDAIEKMKIGIEALLYLRKRDASFKICSGEKLTGLEIAPGYYFPQIFNESNHVLNPNYKTAIKIFFVNFNSINCEKEKFIFEGIESGQCGLAYKINGTVFSLETNDSFTKQKISGKYTPDGKKCETVEIDNISEKKHVDIHWIKLGTKIYEANPKHKANFGWGSPMDLNDNEAQYVLDRSVIAGDEDKHLIAMYQNIYYSFRCHWKNYYHGYQDNSMPENMKRRLTNIPPIT